jgi:hypothetical protein
MNGGTSSSGGTGSGGSGPNRGLLKQQISKIKKYDPTQPEDSTIEADSFAEDGSGPEACMKPHATLQVVMVDVSLGGGQLSVDASTALSIGNWSSLKRQKLAALRGICQQAVTLIGQSIPAMRPHLSRVRDGFDSTNLTYQGFASHSIICINFAAYMQHITDHAVRSKKYPRDLLHEFVMTVTHEFAHLLVVSPGHDSTWRDAHCSLLKEVYASLVPPNPSMQLARGQEDGTICCTTCASCLPAGASGG